MWEVKPFNDKLTVLDFIPGSNSRVNTLLICLCLKMILAVFDKQVADGQLCLSGDVIAE